MVLKPPGLAPALLPATSISLAVIVVDADDDNEDDNVIKFQSRYSNPNTTIRTIHAVLNDHDVCNLPRDDNGDADDAAIVSFVVFFVSSPSMSPSLPV